MIRDLSLTLQAILDDPALAATFPELAAAQIVLDRPVEPFNPTQTTVDLFLYDIREDMELRNSEPTIERQDGHAVIHHAPLRVACSYLVTAWPVGGSELALQEHRLLSQVLQALSRYPRIPVTYLKGKLVGQEPPLPMLTAQTDGLKSPAEFWTALGNKLRPSITITVTIGLEVFAPEPAAPIVITEEVRMGERASAQEEKIKTGTQQELFRIGGRVTSTGNAPVAGATVLLVERGLTATTNSDGRYSLGMIPAGTYTLRVQAGTTVKDVAITIPALVENHYDVPL